MTEPYPIKVMIVDDHEIVRRGLESYLEGNEAFVLVASVGSGEEAVRVCPRVQPDIVVMDVVMPQMDGIETTRRVLATGRAVKVVALTASMDEARMMGVLRAGAVGYVRKDAEPEILLAAVRAVAAGRTFIDPGVGQTLVAARLKPGALEDRDELTPRELHVLRHLALGRSNREIAASLDIGDETVKTHVARVLSKLQVENRAQAIVQALKRGLVTLEELEDVS